MDQPTQELHLCRRGRPPERVRLPLQREAVAQRVPSVTFNSALLCSLISAGEREREDAEINGLSAGLAAAGPALEDRLHQQHGLRECQAGRILGPSGLRRSAASPISLKWIP
jgi:hypothetical protein